MQIVEAQTVPAATCARCGVFIQPASASRVDGVLYCAACASRPDVDYLEAFRLKYWGKRDGWAWSFGLGGLLSAFLLVLSLVEVARARALGETAILLPILALLSVMQICFWLGKRWARVALIAVIAAAAVAVVATLGVGALSGFVIPFVVTISVYNDPRNQLFFKVQVPRARLKKVWDLYCNNRIARAGFILGVFCLVCWPIAPVAVILSIIGLYRVDPLARPPIGRRRQAIAGIVLGCLGTLAMIAFALAMAFGN